MRKRDSDIPKAYYTTQYGCFKPLTVFEGKKKKNIIAKQKDRELQNIIQNLKKGKEEKHHSQIERQRTTEHYFVENNPKSTA